MNAFRRDRVEETCAIAAVLLILLTMLVDPRLSFIIAILIVLSASIYMVRRLSPSRGHVPGGK